MEVLTDTKFVVDGIDNADEVSVEKSSFVNGVVVWADVIVETVVITDVVAFSTNSSLDITHVSLLFQLLSQVAQGRGLKNECMK